MAMEQKTEPGTPAHRWSCRAWLLLALPTHTQAPACPPVSHLTTSPESTSTPLTWNIVSPSPYLQWSLLRVCPIHTIAKNYNEIKGKQFKAQSTLLHFAGSRRNQKNICTQNVVWAKRSLLLSAAGTLHMDIPKASPYLKEKVQMAI